MWFKWLLIGMYVLAAFNAVRIIGLPRDPMTGRRAATLVLASTLLIIGLLHFWR